MIFNHLEFDGHEEVIYCHDDSLGLKAIIAIHSSQLGPAAGGCRMYPYDSEQAALTDVLRLSKGMTYKNAVAGLPLGGGKSVIIADPSCSNKTELLQAFSYHVQQLNGRYWTAVDVGVGPHDADVMAENCDYIFARASQYEPGFSPSSFTSLGGFIGIKAAVASCYGRQDLTGLKVAVQGLGATGFDLSRQLHEAGAELFVADVRADVVDLVVEQFGAVAVSPDAIHAQEVDVFAPCAMGAVLNPNTIVDLKAKVVCGLANNQLATEQIGLELQQRGIVYVPDYVVNAGGMMGASRVIYTTPSREVAKQSIHTLYDTIFTILERAKTEGICTTEIANDMAKCRIQMAKDSKEKSV